MKKLIRKVWRYQRGNQTPLIAAQTIQWQKKDIKWSTKHHTEYKRLSNTNPAKTRDERMCSGRVLCSCSLRSMKLNWKMQSINMKTGYFYHGLQSTILVNNMCLRAEYFEEIALAKLQCTDILVLIKINKNSEPYRTEYTSLLWVKWNIWSYRTDKTDVFPTCYIQDCHI